MIIIGIDPGTATTGFGIIKKDKNDFQIVDFGVIATSSKLSDSERLLTLGEDIESLIKKYKPSCIGVEKLFFTTNQKTVMTVSQARGVILYLAQKQLLPLYEFTPLQVKSFICGYGKADKKQVQFVVQKIFGLKKPPKPDDTADALAIALCAGHYASKFARVKSSK
ncbi:MAG: crossover junction endodeoxyribonuclease RuvC [Patescibacteria group bacterium]